MKKLFTLLALIVLTTINAQAPQGFNYQATVRNSAGALITNQNVLFKFNIMLNSQTSLPVYSETHQAPTDDLGQVNLVIGTGTPTTGTFAGINWANGSYFLGIELNTGNGYVAMGTTQLLSVPFALYANSAGSTTTNNGFTHYIGEAFGGGVIFHLWKDAQGVEHGLIVDKTDLSTSQAWSNMAQTLIGATAQSSWDGLSNSNAIVAQAGHSNSAAALCLNSSNGGQNDWYLPSVQELHMLWNNYYTVARSLTQISGATQLLPTLYWSSTEYGNNVAWSFYFFNGFAFNHIQYRNFSNYVRAVRAF